MRFMIKSLFCVAMIGTLTLTAQAASSELRCNVSAVDKQNPTGPKIVFEPAVVTISKASGVVVASSKDTAIQARLQLDGIPLLSKNYPHVVSMEAAWSQWEVVFTAREAADAAELKTTVSHYEITAHCVTPAPETHGTTAYAEPGAAPGDASSAQSGAAL